MAATTQTTKPRASDHAVIAAIHAEPGLRKAWRPLRDDQKRRVLETAKGCTDSECLMKAMNEARVEQISLEFEIDGKKKNMDTSRGRLSSVEL